MIPPICPKCGSRATERETMYGIRHECCGLWSYKGRPLVDRATHIARIRAHQVFDLLWQEQGFRRSTCYALLAKELKIPGHRCHIAEMDYEMLLMIPDAVSRILANYSPDKPKKWRPEHTFPKCSCGNIISKQRQADGIDVCPSCERNNLDAQFRGWKISEGVT